MAVRYFPEASSISFKRSMVYGLSTLVLLCQYALHRSGLARFEFLAGKKR